MALNEDVTVVAESRFLSVAAKVGAACMPLVVAAMVYVGHTLTDLTDRVGKMETTMNLIVPTVYPRGEALNALATVNARIDGVAEAVSGNSHRIGALEDVRQTRLH